MSWKKGCLIAVVALLALGAIVVAVVFYATSGAVEAADEFLETVGRGDLDGAYRQTAPAFQAQQDREAFERVIGQLGLTEYESRSWSSRSVEGGRAEVAGTVKTRAGDRIPLEMTLIKSEGEWRVFSLSGEQAGAAVRQPGEDRAEAPPPTAVPADEDLAGLATESVLALNRSILDRDFTSFYGSVSKLWQAQTSVEELAAAFRVFVDNEIDLSGVADLEPVFEPRPEIDSEGALRLSGYFPTAPVRVFFGLRYVREAAGWKLLGIQVDLKE